MNRGVTSYAENRGVASYAENRGVFSCANRGDFCSGAYSALCSSVAALRGYTFIETLSLDVVKRISRA